MTDATYCVAIGPAVAAKLAKPPKDAPEQEVIATRRAWAKLNRSFANMHVTQTELATGIKAGHVFTTWHGNGWRHSKNYICGQHLGVDFDDGQGIPTLLQDSLIGAWGSILYTTHSHTPEAPRTRVVFLLDEPIMQAANYALAAQALLWLFQTADAAAKDPCRQWYGCKPGQGQVVTTTNIMPLALVKQIVSAYKRTGELYRESMERMRSRETKPADYAMIEAALSHIPAETIPYNTWFKAIVAVKSQLPGDDGMALADWWAKGYEGEVAYIWSRITRTDVSIGWLFAVAKDYGFDPKAWRQAHEPK